MNSDHGYGLISNFAAVGLEGPSLTTEETDILRAFPPAGVILFERNVIDAAQLGSLVSAIRDACRDSVDHSPLVMADHEGGRISVLSRALGAPPNQYALAACEDPARRLAVYTETARRLNSVGVNTLLSPLADVNSQRSNPVIGTRAFSDSVVKVSELVAEAVKAFGEEGILTCLKHFPGHGSSESDSHLTLPALSMDLEEIMESEIPPFRSGIEAGADMVMTAHVKPRGRGLPASLDRDVVNGLLRQRIGFGGVVITDALEMKGARQYGGAGRREEGLWDVVRKAVEAGNDILLFSDPVVKVSEALDRYAGPARDKVRSLLFRRDHRKSESSARIAKIVNKASFVAGRKSSLPSEKAYSRAAGEAVRIIADPLGRLPLDRDCPPVLIFAGERGDFYGGVVESFVSRVVSAIRRDDSLGVGNESGPGLSKRTSGSEETAIVNEIKPFRAYPSRGKGEETAVFEYVSGEMDDGEGPRILFLLFRKAVSRKAVEEMAGGVDIVVICDWPYAADYVPEGRTVISTRGIYPSAGTVIGRLLLSGGRD